MTTSNSKLGLLYLAHLLISADGIIDAKEYQALSRIKEKESISDEDFKKFEQAVVGKKEREIYREGIELINNCTDEEKLNAFVHLYKMSETDGRVHIKEVRLLLYTIKNAGIEFNDVVDRAKSITDY
ncbi:MAG: TerB family tellurite resistance protein [Cyclobacteriaceae bacterium]|nr:MAG: TerB family tellurite resistance protein [Cyclobacteriaceae bacterium]